MIRTTKPARKPLVRTTQSKRMRRKKSYKIYKDSLKGKQKIKQCHKNWNVNAKEYIKQYNLRKKLKYYYNITLKQYNEMFAKQNGCCAICGRHQDIFKVKLSVDHNHTTGKNRDLLCNNCNSMLGQSHDNIDILKSAIAYLERHV